MSRWPNFDESEFRSAWPSCSLSDMDPSFMNRLQTARDLAGIPFVINSAYRTRDHEIKMGRSGASMHVQGRAVDLRCHDNANRYRIIKAAMQAGFNGIGVGNGFVHLDDRSQPVIIWTYYD